MIAGDEVDYGPCPVGHYCELGTENPTACEKGHYRPTTGGITSSFYHCCVVKISSFVLSLV